MKSVSCVPNSKPKKPSQVLDRIELRQPRQSSLFEGAPIARHHFTAAMVSMFIDLVLSGPASQRAAAAILQLLARRLNWDDIPLPTANSGRLWTFRLGFYALHCEKPRADDWLWMMDHTVQLGPWKCFVVVGIRLSVWQSLDRPLRHEDLSLLNLTPMKTADKEAVALQLEKTYSKMGPPAAIVSDEGTELKGGMTIFQRRLESNVPKPPLVHDIKHKAAILLRKNLQASDVWDLFVKKLSRTKVNVVLTSLAFLNPPRLRNKARFMNLDCVVNWGRRVLNFLSSGMDFPDEPLDFDKLEAKLGWLPEFSKSLDEWAEWLVVIEAAEKYVRCHGYHKEARKELEKILKPLAKKSSSRRLMSELLEFVDQESRKLKAGLRVLGHTEVLESLLGKYKQTQARHSQGGMTTSILNIGAIISQKTPEAINHALSRTEVKKVIEWARTNLGRTIASKRKMALK